MRLTPRAYQTEAVDRVAARWAEGIARQLGVAATGLGKTIIFSLLTQQLGCRTLILAHRDELIRQAVAKILQVWPEAPSIGIVKGSDNEVGAHIVVASVQTVSRPNRLARLCPSYDELHNDEWNSWSGTLVAQRPFGLVITDEAHHAAAPSYRRIYDHLGVGREGGPLSVGVTATPDRGDGKGLDSVYDEVSFNYDTLWGIRHGYLVDPVGLALRIDKLDLDTVKLSRGDYQAGDMGRAMEDVGAPRLIAAGIAQHARDRRTLAFLPTKETARHTSEACSALGMRSAYVDENTDEPARRSIKRGLEDGDYDVVCNVMLWTEGFDVPAIDCVCVGRATKARGLYAQMVGRGLRLYPGKSDCLVLDCVGAADQHSLITLPTLFGLPGDIASRGHDGRTPVSVLVSEHEQNEVRLGHLRAEEVELFRAIRREGLAWVSAQSHTDHRRRYVLQVARGVKLVMLEQERGEEESWAVQVQNEAQGNNTLIRDVTLEICQGVGEDFARIHGDRRLMDPGAGWRAEDPTPAQLAAARKWHLPLIESYKTRGDLSDAMTAHIETIRLRKRKA